MKIIFSLIALSIILANCVNDSESKSRRRKWCHLNEAFYGCSDPLKIYTSVVGGTGIMHTDMGFTVGKVLYKEAANCMDNWTKKCMAPWQHELVDVLFVQSWNNSVQNFLETKRKKFLTHSPCLHEMVKKATSYREICVQQIQAGYEYIHTRFADASLEVKIRAICCIYNRWEHCITSHLLQKCGPVSDEIIIDLIRAGSIDLTAQLCGNKLYDFRSESCADLLSPVGIKPLGFRSEAFLSHIFSYFCPNVGYGIDLSRDNDGDFVFPNSI